MDHVILRICYYFHVSYIFVVKNKDTIYFILPLNNHFWRDVNTA